MRRLLATLALVLALCVGLAGALPRPKIGDVSDVVLPEEEEERKAAMEKFEASGKKQHMMFVKLKEPAERGGKALASRYTDMSKAGGLPVSMYAIDKDMLLATIMGHENLEECKRFLLSQDEVDTLELDGKTITREDMARTDEAGKGGLGDLDELLATLKRDGVVGDNFGLGDLEAAAAKGGGGGMGGMMGGMGGGAPPPPSGADKPQRKRRRKKKAAAGEL